jgi:hypothetical protein
LDRLKKRSFPPFCQILISSQFNIEKRIIMQ